ncbi:hypothetical protein QIW57_08890 [Francisellaceae bacterium CB52]
MKESMCKYRSCLMSLFCFESICVEKVASMLFKTMFIIMSIILIMNLYTTTSACVDNTISFGVSLYDAFFGIMWFVIGLGLFRLLLEIPVVLHKILNAITHKEVSCPNEQEMK